MTHLDAREDRSCLHPLAVAAETAEQKARDAEWNKHPAAPRLRREADALKRRLNEGEHFDPLF